MKVGYKTQYENKKKKSEQQSSFCFVLSFGARVGA
jgi:hypothetical protein